MSGKHKPRPLPSLRIDRRDEGFGDGGTPHVAEIRMREAEQAFAMKHRARELRAKAAELRSSVAASNKDLFAGIPLEQLLAHAETITPQPGAEMLVLINAMELDLDAIETDEAADRILADVTARIARAYDLAARAENTGAKRNKGNQKRGETTRRDFDRAVAALVKKNQKISTRNVRHHWPVDADPISDDRIRALIQEAQRNFALAVVAVTREGAELSISNVKRHWPADAPAITDDHFYYLIKEQEPRRN